VPSLVHTETERLHNDCGLPLIRVAFSLRALPTLQIDNGPAT
jgi:hypothetical protein